MVSAPFDSAVLQVETTGASSGGSNKVFTPVPFNATRRPLTTPQSGSGGSSGGGGGGRGRQVRTSRRRQNSRGAWVEAWITRIFECGGGNVVYVPLSVGLKGSSCESIESLSQVSRAMVIFRLLRRVTVAHLEYVHVVFRTK